MTTITLLADLITFKEEEHPLPPLEIMSESWTSTVYKPIKEPSRIDTDVEVEYLDYDATGRTYLPQPISMTFPDQSVLIMFGTCTVVDRTHIKLVGQFSTYSNPLDAKEEDE